MAICHHMLTPFAQNCQHMPILRCSFTPCCQNMNILKINFYDVITLVILKLQLPVPCYIVRNDATPPVLRPPKSYHSHIHGGVVKCQARLSFMQEVKAQNRELRRRSTRVHFRGRLIDCATEASRSKTSLSKLETQFFCGYV